MQKIIPNPQPALLSGISPILAKYQAVVVDLWGVLHDGVKAFPHACDVLAAWQSQGTRIILLSNAPRRSHIVAAKLRGLGIPDSAYDVLITSGEACYRALEQAEDPLVEISREGRTSFYHLGPERDTSLYQGITHLQTTKAVQEAAFILNSGPELYEDNLEDYQEILSDALSRKLVMLCANPDREVMVGDRRVLCAGSLAQWYEEQGGMVSWYGKPYPPIYHYVASELEQYAISPEQVAVFGDSLLTDIAGANVMGWDSYLIADGILHQQLGEPVSPQHLHRLCQEFKAWPSGVLPKLCLS